ncbi:MAG: sporulation transcriptional regulator SpoIIID [Clostridia bacterium]|nr:sporulation transcriptional regulator SpoIIID [Clostridia bacterium]
MERCEILGLYIAENNATVRSCAKRYGVSKSTVHKDVTRRLTACNPSLAACVKSVLEKNKAERHIRGGMATREKYLLDRQLKSVNNNNNCCSGQTENR